MDEITYCTRRAFVPAVLAGSFGAPMIWWVLMPSDDWWIALLSAPMVGMAFGLMGCLFVAIGLAVFGFPAVWLLRPFLRQRWMVLIAAAWGGITGEIVARTLLGEAFNWKFNQLGFLFNLFGCVTGIAWWVFYQRAAKVEEERDIERQAYIRWLQREG
jgi:hypothetical protein